jgi:hypothetical protein
VVRLEEDGKSVVFSGDAGYSPSPGRLTSDADFFVAEYSYPIRKEKGHLNLSALHGIVELANPWRVVMTHLSPEREEFRGSVKRKLSSIIPTMGINFFIGTTMVTTSVGTQGPAETSSMPITARGLSLSFSRRDTERSSRNRRRRD